MPWASGISCGALSFPSADPKDVLIAIAKPAGARGHSFDKGRSCFPGRWMMILFGAIQNANELITLLRRLHPTKSHLDCKFRRGTRSENRPKQGREIFGIRQKSRGATDRQMLHKRFMEELYSDPDSTISPDSTRSSMTLRTPP
jgi:hypothetical protein